MTKVLFVCHGNICRSPMAELVLRDMAARRGVEVCVESAATSAEELGNPVYPPARRVLVAHGLDPSGKRARQLTAKDYGKFDLIIGMDRANMRSMQRLFGGDRLGKLRLLLDYTSTPRDVADPWYTGDFEKTWEDITRGCAALLDTLQ